MASPIPSVPRSPEAAGLPIAALIDELERVPEPALLHLSGGRIAGVNRAATRLFDLPGMDMTIDELLDLHDPRRADGSRIIRSDLPNIRALRGEIVAHGERFRMNFADGSSYHALVTSTPVVVDGKVVAAITIWHDFGAYVRTLTGEPASPETDGPADEYGGDRPAR